MSPNQTCENCGRFGLDTFIENEKQILLRCADCGLYQKGFLESSSVYEGYYHDDYTRRLISKTLTATIRLGSAKQYLQSENPRSLDIGCSIGATVAAAAKMGWNATGVDISESAVVSCQRRGLDCRHILDVELPFENDTFDIVTNWHVIEHVRSVRESLAEWNRVLKPGGMMMIETPDSAFLKARFRGNRHKKFWPPDHLYTFNRKNLSSLLRQAGFQILPTQLIGGWTALPPHLTVYAVCYRGYRELWRSVNLCKSMEITCRKARSNVEVKHAVRHVA